MPPAAFRALAAYSLQGDVEAEHRWCGFGETPAEPTAAPNVCEIDACLRSRGEAVAYGGAPLTELEFQPVALTPSSPAPLSFTASPSSVARVKSDSAPPEGVTSTVRVGVRFAPRSDSGLCCQASEPRNQRSRKPFDRWLSGPRPRGSASSPCAGAESVGPASRSWPKPISASPPSWCTPPARLGVRTSLDLGSGDPVPASGPGGRPPDLEPSAKDARPPVRRAAGTPSSGTAQA